jgi:hypothetical protein
MGVPVILAASPLIAGGAKKFFGGLVGVKAMAHPTEPR